MYIRAVVHEAAIFVVVIPGIALGQQPPQIDRGVSPNRRIGRTYRRNLRAARCSTSGAAWHELAANPRYPRSIGNTSVEAELIAESGQAAEAYVCAHLKCVRSACVGNVVGQVIGQILTSGACAVHQS